MKYTKQKNDSIRSHYINESNDQQEKPTESPGI